jgi:hypothetical protein
MAAPAVNPLAALASAVATGGLAVTAFPGGISGGIIQNPYSSTDQNIASPPGPEQIYVDPINVPGSAPGAGNGTTFVLAPGQVWTVIPGQTTLTRVNAPTSGHKYSAVFWF